MPPFRFFVDDRYYVLGHQHLCRAVIEVSEERKKNGLPLEDWMTHIRGDILRFSTTLNVRRRLAGQENAMALMAKKPTLPDFARALLKDNPPPTERTIQHRIRRGLENCGLNIDVEMPVCYHVA